MNDDNRPTHAVKAVIKNEAGKILFLQRQPDPVMKVIPNWDFPGGIVEEGEEDTVALRREVLEELGVDSKVGDQIGHWTFLRAFDQKTVDVTNYSVEVLSDDFVLSGEHVGFTWVTFEEAKSLPVKDQSIFAALGH